MGRDTRRKVTHWLKRAAAGVMLCVVAFTAVQPVFADPPEDKKPVEHLVVVTDTPWLKSDLENALRNEEAHDAGGDNLEEYEGLEHSDHRFVDWSNDPNVLKSRVSAAVTDLRGTFPGSEAAVVFWMGFQDVDDTVTFTHERLKKVELEDNIKDKVQEEYTVEVEVTNPDTGQTEIVEETRTRWVDSDTGEKQYEWETYEETHWKKAAVRYSEVVDAEGGLGEWLLNAKVQEYWIGMPPNGVKLNGKVYDGLSALGNAYTSDSRLPDSVLIGGSGGTGDEEPIEKGKNELFGFWAKKWNAALTSAGSVIDIWDAAAGTKLYYTDRVHMLGSGYHGNPNCYQSEWSSGVWVGAPTADLGRPELPDDSGNEKFFETHRGDLQYNQSDADHSGVNAYEFYSYTDASYQQLFHIILETVQNKNVVPASADPIRQDMYSISSALTAYVSNTLSANAKDGHDLPSVGNPGNAGALLGYGDAKKGFTEGIIVNLSKTSSAVSYDALKKASMTDELRYAQYGRLLAQMGLDEYGIKTPGLSVRNVTGSMMLVVFSLSLVAAKLFGWFIDLMLLLNPFRFFVSIPGFAPLAETVQEMDENLLSSALKSIVNSGTYKNFANLFSSIYNGLNSWSWAFVIPVSLALIVFGIFFGTGLLNGRFDKQVASHKILSFLFRVAFLAIGIPVLGILYTNTLTYFVVQSEDVHSPATQVVASTFLDFGAWAEHSRLSPSTGKFELLVSDSNLGGEATGDTVGTLRDTVLSLNKTNNVVNDDISMIAGGSDALDWSNNALHTDEELDDESIKQCYSLLTSYLSGSFYYPSNWESSVGEVMNEKAQDGTYESGRRKGGEEEDFDSEVLQGEDTYYNMYDSVNEMEDWTGRTAEENSKLFTDPSKWRGFNLLSNGSLSVSESENTLIYTNPDHTFSSDVMNAGVDPSNKGGLSTMSLYNYLSSKFSSEGVVMYSNSNTANVGSRYSHYAVTTAGSGVTGALYFANGFVLLMIVSIVGLCYLMGALFNVLRKGVQMMTALPAAALGVMKSISQVIATVLSMIAEMLMIGFLYTVVIELLSSVMALVEVVVQTVGSGGSLITTSIFGTEMSLPVEMVVVALFGSTVFLAVAGVFLWKYQRAGRKLLYTACDRLMEWMLPELAAAYARKSAVQTNSEREFIPVSGWFGNPVYGFQYVHRTFTKSLREWLAFVWDLLYTDDADESLVPLVSCCREKDVIASRA